MKTARFLFVVLVPIMVTGCALAQEAATAAPVQTACGPLEVRFDAQASPSDSNPRRAAQPEAGKALVYVMEYFRKAPGEWGNPTIRVGVDGSWQGAVRHDSYLSFAVEPGEHHLCTSWQSRLQRLSKLASFAGFTAEAGKVYYFRARISYSSYGGGGATMDLNLEPVNPDEGQYLVASYEPSASHPKK
jgi:hypothetical protein